MKSAIEKGNIDIAKVLPSSWALAALQQLRRPAVGVCAVVRCRNIKCLVRTGVRAECDQEEERGAELPAAGVAAGRGLFPAGHAGQNEPGVRLLQFLQGRPCCRTCIGGAGGCQHGWMSCCNQPSAAKRNLPACCVALKGCEAMDLTCKTTVVSCWLLLALHPHIVSETWYGNGRQHRPGGRDQDEHRLQFISNFELLMLWFSIPSQPSAAGTA